MGADVRLHELCQDHGHRYLQIPGHPPGCRMCCVCAYQEDSVCSVAISLCKCTPQITHAEVKRLLHVFPTWRCKWCTQIRTHQTQAHLNGLMRTSRRMRLMRASRLRICSHGSCSTMAGRDRIRCAGVYEKSVLGKTSM